MNHGLALRILEGANGAPWRFLSGYKHAGGIGVEGEPQLQPAGRAILRFSRVYRKAAEIVPGVAGVA